MTFFIVFVFAAVLLGAGAMLSPAWRTAQPRIALSATLCLAIVVVGAVFYAKAFGWDTLVVDYLLFALLSGVVLGGTLSTAQARAEARGEQLADRDQGWPGPADLAFFALVALVVLIPLFYLPAPLGTQGQISGFHSLTTRAGESFNTLAPFLPGQKAIIAPGFHALSAYLSQQLSQPVPRIQMSVSAVVFFLLVWLAYDFGAELRDKRLGRSMAIAMLLGAGAQRSFLDGHFAELLALLFMLAFLIYALRLMRNFNLADLIAGGLMMGAVIYTNLTISLAMLLGFVTLCAIIWLDRRGGVTSKSRWSLTIGLPLVALLGIAPWLISDLPLMLPISPSLFVADPSNIVQMTFGQGIVILPLALWGAVIGWRQGGIMRTLSLLMVVWLLLVSEFSLFGVIGRALPPLGAVTNAPNLARHGVILPFSFFAGIALLQFWDMYLSAGVKRRLRQSAYKLMALTAVLILLLGIAFNPILDTLRPLLDLPAATLTQDDIAAMTWLREHTDEDALLLSADGDAWLPLFAERRTRDVRAVRYFEWDQVTEAAVARAEVDYVFVPAGADPPADLDLKLVFERGAARVFAVLSS